MFHVAFCFHAKQIQVSFPQNSQTPWFVLQDPHRTELPVFAGSEVWFFALASGNISVSGLMIFFTLFGFNDFQ